ncbi:MAG: biotin/lipoyl-containing protein [Alphaproteobacteria bacterium]|jgi:2-oxoglutarate dehydrogenase E2 component (dihydrolipoamide succinyltransferase)|nr:biotin/lipoyl-containing protein [Alphaproteobacteria bacterium]MDP6622085.1 biotin/lipoyl-containing protein [Alphaproteobacteria bacterium]MDP7603962.1 biotin/lipoyl-containing protein [Alphaproteobacteria bacterium]HJP21022.1 biotin/lipoyl-containing protein [Alphaproteobacteria bacterium]|tara:strand:- start:1771 stop:2010 length:240 start_codon:yes stop_codon:yes gene_type:complete
MSVDIVVPEVGEGVTEATIVQWLKAPGDGVAAGEIILEIMTDKVNVEIESPASGVLTEILFGADEELRVGTVIGRIDES